MKILKICSIPKFTTADHEKALWASHKGLFLFIYRKMESLNGVGSLIHFDLWNRLSNGKAKDDEDYKVDDDADDL